MKKNYFMILLSCIMCVLLITGCSQGSEKKEEKAGSGMSDSEITEMVVDEFSLLTKVPRPSHHEKKISDFLVGWAKEHGFSPKQDDVYNVMFDVPATKGYEDMPLCVLQGHMDMVVAVEEGKKFDPLNDPITMIRDEKKKTLTADGTSLGADDGIGVAMIMAAAEGKMEHGPLRMLITVDEEDGMVGAFNLDKSWIEDAKYLINIDNEASDNVLVSTASGYSVDISKKVKLNDPAYDTALRIKLAGLQGGHSGVEIDKGRMNGLVGLAAFLKELEKSSIDFELADLVGGTASNAIPTGAECTIVVKKSDKANVEDLADKYLEQQKKKYARIDDGMTLEVTAADALPKVVGKEVKANIIQFISEIIDGVHTMSKDMEGLVESSANLGVFSLKGGKISGESTIRSSSVECEKEIIRSHKKLSKKCGFKVKTIVFARPWPYDPDSRLLKFAKEIYKEQNGEDVIVAAVHAGLECGAFAELNPKMDMISIGPDLVDVHTVNETLYIDSIPKVWKLLEGILVKVQK